LAIVSISFCLVTKASEKPIDLVSLTERLMCTPSSDASSGSKLAGALRTTISS